MSNFVNSNNSRRPGEDEYQKVIQGISERNECPFCIDNLSKTHKNPVLDDNHHWIATDNAFPYEGAEHHLLFIHKEHIQTIEEMDPAAWQSLKLIVESMKSARKIRGATLLMRFGETAFTGASVTHLHAQLVSGTGKPDAKPVLGRLG